MTIFAIESVLYDLGVKKAARAAFAKDSEVFLSGYNLSEKERQAIVEFDVFTLQKIQASPLLTMGFWMTNASDRSRTAYLAQLTTPISKKVS